MSLEQVATSTKTVFTLDECKGHGNEKDCWLVIHGKVYDVTEFLDEHPGGYDIVVAAAGKDATEDFEEIGHSSTAQQMLDKYYIGEFAGGDARAAKAKKVATATGVVSSKSSPIAALIKALLPLILVALAVALALQLQGSK